MPGPPAPPACQLPPSPPRDGSVLELSFGKLTAQLEWLFESVDLLSKKMDEVTKHLEAQSDMWNRLDQLENKKAPEPQVVLQERAKTPPRVEEPKIEIPYVPTEAERAEEARRAVKPMLDAEVSALLQKINANSARIATLEEFCGRTNPWDRMQQYMQDLGFLPFGEPEEKDPLVLMGKVFVLFRQGIDMCPKIKDLEDAKEAMGLRINEVESNAAADCEAKAQKAAAESAKIRDDVESLDKIVKALLRKNEDDGDVAGSLRDLLLRADNVEEKRFPRLELRVQKLEDAEKPEVGGSGPRAKGFLEEISEVDLNDEVRRLRTMVECMEAAMPYETRQTMQYFRASGGANMNATNTNGAGTGTSMATTAGGGGGGGNASDFNRLRTELQEQLERHKQKGEREQQNMAKNLKLHERNVEKLESQITDLWKKLPKVLAVLQPLQAQLENYLDAGPQDGVIDSTGGPGTGASPGRPPSVPVAAPIPVQMLGAGAPPAGTAAPSADAGAATSPSVSRELVMDAGPAPTGSIPASPPDVANRGIGSRGMMMGGFSPMPEGAGGTGEGLMAPSKDKDYSPTAHMGYLAGLVKVALQSTTNEIHANLHQDMHKFRAELLNGLEGKANKSELLALASRLDAWTTQKSRGGRGDKDRFRETFTKGQDRSLSPRSDQAADTTRDTLRHGYTAPAGKLGQGATSPTQTDKNKKPTCHDRCKEPTAPRALQMSQSLSRLPALKPVLG